jgi:hypothetical protein
MAIYAGKGTSLQMSTVSTGSTTLSTGLTQVVSINFPQPTNPPVDVTVLDSTWRQFLGTIADGGTAGLEIIWDQANPDHQLLASLVTASTPREYKIVGPTTTRTAFFRALVTDFSPQSAVVENVWRANVSLKIDGPVSFTTA